MNIVQGDLLKALEMQLTLADVPFPINVGTDTLSLKWTVGRPELGGASTTVTPSIVDAPTGQIKYDFIVGQTDTVGTYYGRVTLTRSGKPIHFPDDNTYFQWTVHP